MVGTGEDTLKLSKSALVVVEKWHVYFKKNHIAVINYFKLYLVLNLNKCESVDEVYKNKNISRGLLPYFELPVIKNILKKQKIYILGRVVKKANRTCRSAEPAQRR